MPDLPVLLVFGAGAFLLLRVCDLSRAPIPTACQGPARLQPAHIHASMSPWFALHCVLPFHASKIGRAVEFAAVIICS